ncbi:TadE/TadG family type IV pilus assembly protein [Zobellella aerophila]|uniref:TadE-like domain-containing protein n=1 Tax=Zobellella aerophila TaxID=870480 RepID=A0ABP6VDE2_9GAMM
MNRYHFKLPRRQQGLAAVEATVVLPVLLLLLLAIGEFGRLLYQYNTLTKAVRAGSHIVLDSDNYADIAARGAREDKIKSLILYGVETGGSDPVLPGLAADDISFSYDETPVGSGDFYYQVSVNYDWQPVLGTTFNTFFGNTLSLSFPLRTSITVREL